MNIYYDSWVIQRPYCTKTPNSVPYALQSLSPTTTLPAYIKFDSTKRMITIDEKY